VSCSFSSSIYAKKPRANKDPNLQVPNSKTNTKPSNSKIPSSFLFLFLALQPEVNPLSLKLQRTMAEGVFLCFAHRNEVKEGSLFRPLPRLQLGGLKTGRLFGHLTRPTNHFPNVRRINSSVQQSLSYLLFPYLVLILC